MLTDAPDDFRLRQREVANSACDDDRTNVILNQAAGDGLNGLSVRHGLRRSSPFTQQTGDFHGQYLVMEP